MVIRARGPVPVGAGAVRTMVARAQARKALRAGSAFPRPTGSAGTNGGPTTRASFRGKRPCATSADTSFTA